MMITFGALGPSQPGAPLSRVPVPGWDAPAVYERFTQRGRQVLVRAQDVGRELGHPHVGTEHLLLGELAEGEGLGAWALESLGVGQQAAMETLAGLVPPTRTPPAHGVPFTVGARCALELSLVEVQSRRLAWVNTEHLLLGVCAELDACPEDDVAHRTLAALGVSTARIRAALDPYVREPPVVLSWALRGAPELEFRDLPGLDWARLLPVPADLALRRLLVDSAAVALDAGRHVIESCDLLAAAGGVPAGAAAEVCEWTRVEAGRPVVSALVGASSAASKQRAEVVTVEDLRGSLVADQRALLGRAGWPPDPPVV
jgi:hypothetical protein